MDLLSISRGQHATQQHTGVYEVKAKCVGACEPTGSLSVFEVCHSSLNRVITSQNVRQPR